MKRFVMAAAMLGLSSFFVCIAPAYPQTITTFDPPNSTYTISSAINPSGQITGYYSNGTGHHGFVRRGDGTFTTFDAFIGTPGGFPSNAFPIDINAAGQVTGFYQQETVFGSFLRLTNGEIVLFQPSSSDEFLPREEAIEQGPRPFCPIDGSAALAINDVGQITGGYTPILCHGFIRQRDGTTASFDVRSEDNPG